MAKKEVVFEILSIFSRKTDHIKIRKSAFKCTFRPPKGLKLQETKENHAVYLLTNEWKRKRKEICESNGFFQKCGVALTHHHGDFF